MCGRFPITSARKPDEWKETYGSPTQTPSGLTNNFASSTIEALLLADVQRENAEAMKHHECYGGIIADKNINVI